MLVSGSGCGAPSLERCVAALNLVILCMRGIELIKPSEHAQVLNGVVPQQLLNPKL